MHTAIRAQNEQELLHELSRHASEIKKSDFSQVGKVSVYNLPPRSDRPVSLDGYIYTREEGIIRGLNLSQQLNLLPMLSERFGIPLRHNSLRETFDAVYSPDGQAYKNNVLRFPFWVFTGEMIRELPHGYTIHRVNGVDIVTINPDILEDHLVIEGETRPNIPVQVRQVRQYRAGRVLQTKVPTKTGHFSNFKGVIPVDSEISEKGPDKDRGSYWSGKYFENKLSAVRCVWGSDGGRLYAYAGRPLVRDDGGVLGIGTDAPLNK